MSKHSRHGIIFNLTSRQVSRQAPFYLNIRHLLTQRPTKFIFLYDTSYINEHYSSSIQVTCGYYLIHWQMSLLLIPIWDFTKHPHNQCLTLSQKFKLMVTRFCPVWKLSCCHYLLRLPVHFLVMIFRYSRAFCAALAWASFEDVPLP